VTVFTREPPALPEGVLLRELQHRITNGAASAINLVSAAAVRVEGAEAKRALSDVVELLHGHAELHRALTMPAGETLFHAGTYIRKLGCAMRRALLDRMNIQLAFATQPLPLQPERCWRLGQIVQLLVTCAARRACFDARSGQIKIKLTCTGVLVNCLVVDNGSRSAQMKASRRTRAVVSTATTLAASAAALGPVNPVPTDPDPKRPREHEGELAVRCQAPDALGELLSPCHRTDAQ
jgi:two-component sensor histidine kinase